MEVVSVASVPVGLWETGIGAKGSVVGRSDCFSGSSRGLVSSAVGSKFIPWKRLKSSVGDTGEKADSSVVGKALKAVIGGGMGFSAIGGGMGFSVIGGGLAFSAIGEGLVIGGGLGFSAIGEGLVIGGVLGFSVAGGVLGFSVIGGGLASITKGELSFSATGDRLATTSAAEATDTGLEEASGLVSCESCSPCNCCS